MSNFDFFQGTNVLVLFIGVLIIFLWRFLTQNLPPGPVGLPILGYLPFLGKEAYVTLHELKKKYGSIMSLYLGRRLVVVLGDYEIIKEVLSKEPFLGRPERPPNNLLPNAKSFSAATGNLWREHRRFTLQSLRDLGFGKTRLERHIKDEITYFLKKMKEHEGKPCDVRRYLQSSISNNTSALIFGRRLDYDDPERLFLDRNLRLLTKFFRPTSIHAFFPWIRPLLSFLNIWNYQNLDVTSKKLADFFDKEIENHQQTLDKENTRDYMDDYLIEMEQRRHRESNASFTLKMLKGNCNSLMAAGVEPVLATTEWIVVTMAIYEDVQKKIQKELDSVIGRERLPEWSDNVDLPYTRASLMELQRWRTVVPISMLRCTTEATKVRNYDIPKDTIILTNLWSIHNDSSYWKDPTVYKPERFLDSDGKTCKKLPSFVPFSYGKRSCPGETLAQIELFLYFTTILHCFDVRLPEGVTSDYFKNEIGIAQVIQDYKLCLIPRKLNE